MELPLSHLNPVVIEEVSLPLWAELFAEVGWPASLAGKTKTFTHENVVQALMHDNPSDDLLLALEALDTIGTQSGRDAVMVAMNDQGVAVQALPATSGEREFALRLFIAQRRDGALAEVFARAQIQIQEGADQRRYYEFLGKRKQRVSQLKAKEQALQKEILKYCLEQDLGDHVQVSAFEDDDFCVFRVVRSHHTRKPLALLPGRAARATIEYRPVHGDILRYDSALGQLRIAARAAGVIEFYRRTLGRVLFGDESFFDGDPICSLRVLQERGRAALADHGVQGVGRVWMTECLWDRGDRDLIHIRSRDCFQAIDRLGLPLAEGRMVQARLKLEVSGKSTRPVTVNVRAPSRIEVSQSAHEALVDRFLTAVGIRNAAPASGGVDLWSLHPWRHRKADWLDLFGRDLDALVKAGALVPIQFAAIAHPDHPGAGHVLEAHRLPNAEFYGVSQVEEVPSRSVSPTDLEGLELHPEPFRNYLRSRLGIASGGAPWDGQDLLHLGSLELGEQTIHVSYALRPLAAGAGARLREAAQSPASVVLLPSSQANALELPKLVLDGPLPNQERVVRDAVRVCGLERLVSPRYIAPNGTRLIVDTDRGQVWMDGVAIADLDPGTKPFIFVELVARNHPSFVPASTMCDALSPGRDDGTAVARRAKLDATKALRQAMEAAGKPFHDPFQTLSKSYRCTVASHVS